MAEQEPEREEQEVVLTMPTARGTLRVTGTLTVIRAQKTTEPVMEEEKKDRD